MKIKKFLITIGVTLLLLQNYTKIAKADYCEMSAESAIPSTTFNITIKNCDNPIGLGGACPGIIEVYTDKGDYTQKTLEPIRVEPGETKNFTLDLAGLPDGNYVLNLACSAGKVFTYAITPITINTGTGEAASCGSTIVIDRPPFFPEKEIKFQIYEADQEFKDQGKSRSILFTEYYGKGSCPPASSTIKNSNYITNEDQEYTWDGGAPDINCMEISLIDDDTGKVCGNTRFIQFTRPESPLCIYGDDGILSLQTALGCINIQSFERLAAQILQLSTGIVGGMGLISIAFGALQIIFSAGDPKRIQSGKNLISSSIGGILFLIFSTVMLRVIGINILRVIQ